ncbi:MAG: peptide ABC transporter substrate-binding protein [Candidatus Fimenecus sp.]
MKKLFLKIISMLIALIFTMLSFSSCSIIQKKEGKVFAFPISEEPVSLDPQISNSRCEKTIVQNIFEGLLRETKEGTIVPAAAEKIEKSDDGLTYTFKLKKSLKWELISSHKDLLGDNYNETFNKAVYADDFKFGIERSMLQITKSPYKSLFKKIQEIYTIDKHTLVIKLSVPDENLLNSLATPGAFPCNKDFFEKTGGRYGLDAKYLLSNGPMTMTRWSQGETIRIRKNESYDGKFVSKPTAVNFYINTDASRIPNKLNDEIYDAGILNLQQFSEIKKTYNFSISEIKNTTMSYIFNYQNELTANPNFRMAFAKALNTKKILADENKHNPANGIIPPYLSLNGINYRNKVESVNSIPYDIRNANELFKNALNEINKNSTEITILCSKNDDNFIKSEIQSVEKALGVKCLVSVKSVSWNELFASVKDGNFDIAFIPIISQTGNAAEFIKRIDTASYSSGFDNQFKSLVKNLENSESIENTLLLEKHIITNALIIPVYFESERLLQNKNTAGLWISKDGEIIFFDGIKK